MPDVRARNHRGRGLTLFVAGVATLLFCLLTTASSASAAGPVQATTSTTAPPMLPLTTDPSLPQSGIDSGRLAGLAVSCMLIGWGALSFGEGVRLRRRPRHSAGWSWRSTRRPARRTAAIHARR
jgi:hypothetical protein